MRWLLGWQHLAPQTHVSGEDGLLEALSKLEGFEAPAVEWERTIPPSRVANYDPSWLDPIGRSRAAWKTGYRSLATVRSECWPDIRDHHELHDLLMSLVLLPLSVIDDERSRHLA